MLSSVIVFIPFFVLAISSLEVAPNSNCSLLCMTEPTGNSSDPNSSFTHTHDLACKDWDLSGPNSSVIGRKFLSCISCESNGSHFDPATGESDIDWFLFNIGISVYWCLFDNPNTVAQYSSCNSACIGPQSGLATALATRTYRVNYTFPYQYCEDANGAFAQDVGACMHCLHNIPSSITLRKYLHAMNESCNQQPPIRGNTPIKLDFDLYPRNPDGIIAGTETSSTPSTTSNVSTTTLTSVSTTTQASVPSAVAISAHAPHQRLAIGLGVGLGGAAAITLLTLLMLYHHKHKSTISTLKSEDYQPQVSLGQQHGTGAIQNGYLTEVMSRQSWLPEAEAGKNCTQEIDGEALGEIGGESLAEADDGRPQQPKNATKYFRPRI